MTSLAAFFTDIEAYIARGRAAIAAGEALEIADLSQRIGTLCDRVFEMLPEEQTLYKERLESVLMQLNALGLEMKEDMEKFKDLPLHRHASVAYKTADSRDNFGKRVPEETKEG